MKELSIEEKAKAYDEALKVLHKYDGANIMFTQDLKEEMFPELKENEDEKIMKFIKDVLDSYGRSVKCPTKDILLYEKSIAWLKKQNQVKETAIPQHENKTCKENDDSLTSEDERIRKTLINGFNKLNKSAVWYNGVTNGQILAWLEKQDEPIDKMVKRAMTEKQRVLLTETNGNANIDWDTRSLQDVKLLLEYGLDYIKKLEKQDEQKPIKVYRVENEAEQKGLWRKFDGTWQPLFDMLTDGKCKDMPMEDSPIYREGGKRWFASAPSKETLQKWFSKIDLEELVSKGFTISEFEVVGYKKVSDFEYIFTRDNIINRNYLEVSDIYSERKDFAQNVEPKFHEDEWITNGDYTWKIVEVKPLDYILQSQNGNIVDDTISHVDEQFHSFTVEDAKDGDVLCAYPGADYPWIGIFCKLNAKGTFNSYCYLQAGQHCHFCPPSEENIFGKRNVDNHSSKDVVPATKEQCDLLFQKMKEAGYKWDAKKKELKKEKVDNLHNYLYGEQKPAWSEEDDYVIERLFCLLHNEQDKYPQQSSEFQELEEIENKLKSLKDRVQPQPKQEWSEEDERTYKSILYAFEHNYPFNSEQQKFVKSLKNKYTWKPSDEQIEAIKEALSLAKNCGEEWAFDLRTLYEQLKKLREE